MTKSEALNRLRKNAEEWYKIRDKLKDTKSAMEIDKDYEAIEILLAQTRLDFESMSYEELREFGEYIVKLKRQKYHSSETHKKVHAECNKRYRENNAERLKEMNRKSWQKYKEKNKDKIKAYNIEYQRERRRKKKMENEKVISLFG